MFLSASCMSRSRLFSVWHRLLRSMLISMLCAIPAPYLLAQTSSTASTAEKAGYSLKRTYQVGDIDRCLLTLRKTSINSETGELAISVFQAQYQASVKEIKPNGEIVQSVEFQRIISSNGGHAVDLSDQAPKLIQTLDKSGLTVAVKPDGASTQLTESLSKVLQAMNQFENRGRPEQEVKIGASWKVDFLFAFAKAKSTGKATLAGKERFEGVPTLKVRFVLTETTETPDAKTGTKSESAPTEGVCNYDPMTGRLIHLLFKGTGQDRTDVELKQQPEVEKSGKGKPTGAKATKD